MDNIYDVIVIGGGPAGMMSAGRAAQLGKKVLLLEKNPTLGKKLLISGGGRCNVTNTNTDLKKIYKESGKYLFTTFAQFDTEKTLEFFHNRGMETKVEIGGRIFPVSNRSQSVLDVLVEYMKEGSVEIKCNSTVSKISIQDDIFNISLTNGETYTSRACIVSTGGLSHPETGSTGEGFKWLKELGHTIVENDFALVPIALKDEWAKRIPGTTLENIKISVYCDGVKEFSQKGRILFTHVGVSGPTVLNMSKRIGDLLQTGEVKMFLDLYPTTDLGALRDKLNAILLKDSNKKIQNTLGHMVPSKLVQGILEIGEIDGETFNHSLSKENRKKIVEIIKNIPLHVDHLLGADKAIISSGGVDINEVDFKTMESKKVQSLFLIGDVLDIDRPSGGYSLQLCWTTGYVAGSSC